jgi:eukaryotic-like serine/threonine-protein kinase
MGEVYRAHDAKLNRDVAIKILPEALAADPASLARFEREAQAVAALSHPNILAIHDFGVEGGTRYAVMELLEGETLRARLAQGALPARKAVDLAAQIAEGLAAAHEKGIVHRDLKPENVFVTGEGRAKILDFGLAKKTGPASSPDAGTRLTAGHTGGGTVMGTVGYMSPEEVRGEAVDHRSDIFAFGAVLYEMLAGREAFGRETATESMTAILKEDPPELATATSGSSVSPALSRIVQHCLEKKAGERFQSARDIAFALQALSGSSISSGPSVVVARKGTRLSLIVGGVAVVTAGVVLSLAAAWGFMRPQEKTHPAFRPLTRERGTIGAARFVPGTADALYSARWGSGTSRLYVTKIDQPSPRVIPGFEGLLQSVSASGEIMGLTDLFVAHASQVGQLVSLLVSGGAVRTWADQVWTVSQGEHGEIALVIGLYGEFRLEWPFGRVVLRTRDPLRSARLRGDSLAYFHEQEETVEDGLLSVVDRQGKSRDLSRLRGFTGMAWGPEGKEIWVSTFHDGQSRLDAVDLTGESRTLLTHAGRLELQDVDSRGRALVIVNSYQRQVYARARGSSRDEDLTWLDAQAAVGITDDGKTALLAHLGQWSGCEGRVYLRPLDGSPALDLGETIRMPTLSGDGRWVLTYTKEPVFSLKMIPTGPGVPRVVPIPAFEAYDSHISILDDGRHGIIWGRPEGKAISLFSIDLETGAYRQIAPDGASYTHLQNLVSPGGTRIAYAAAGQPGTLARSDGTDAAPFDGLRRTEVISGWYRDSRSIVVFDRNVIPAPVDALEQKTGNRTPLLKLTPPDPGGISRILGVMMALDSSAYAYNVVRQLYDLHVIEGLK